MGQIKIEIPQHTIRTFRITSAEAAERLLADLNRFIAKANSIEENEVLNLMSDHNESAREIAEMVRSSWQRKI